MMRLQLLAIASALQIYLLGGTMAQNTSHAVCSDPEFEWSFNSLDQSPCTVGEALGNVCTSDGSFNIQPIPAGFHYAGISAAFATNCVCNQVYWSLLNVCAACQGAGVSQWTSWSSNCTVQFPTYPNPIPKDTGVPHYAYLPLLSNGTYDLQSAVKDNGPEVKAGTPPLSTSSSTSSTGTETSSSSTATGSSDSGGGSSHAGAIAGGVVGGVVGLALLGALLLYFLVLRPKTLAKRRQDPIRDIDDDSSEGVVHPFGIGVHHTGASGTGSGMIQRVYDPNDPSTFPPTSSASPFTSAPHSAWTPPPAPGGQFQSPSTSALSASTGAHNYRGAPEI